jgi:hypothetical protein
MHPFWVWFVDMKHFDHSTAGSSPPADPHKTPDVPSAPAVRPDDQQDEAPEEKYVDEEPEAQNDFA